MGIYWDNLKTITSDNKCTPTISCERVPTFQRKTFPRIKPPPPYPKINCHRYSSMAVSSIFGSLSNHEERHKFAYLAIKTVVLHAFNVRFYFLYILQPFSSYQLAATNTVATTFA